MKKTLPFIVCLLLIFSCTNESNTLATSQLKSASSQTQIENYSITYDDANRVINVEVFQEGEIFSNVFSYQNTSNNEVIFNLTYTINTSEIGWKYGEQTKAIQFAEQIKDLQLTVEELQNLDFMIENSYGELFGYINDNSLNDTPFSILAFLKSGVDSNLRMINNSESNISGVISPSFLVGKTFFTFQEDYMIDLAFLRQNIDDLQNVSPKTNEDIALINYIENSTDSLVSYDQLYSFYADIIEFENYINYQSTVEHADDCDDDCYIGCGTDWGCCGSYTGCCYYSTVWCYRHDLACMNCDKWHCGPACTPDAGINRPVKVFIGV